MRWFFKLYWKWDLWRLRRVSRWVAKREQRLTRWKKASLEGKNNMKGPL